MLSKKNDMVISTNGNNVLTANYFKDFIQSEHGNNTNTNHKSSRMQEINYNMNNVENITKSNFNATAIRNHNQNENIKLFNNIKLNTPMNANNILNNNPNANLKIFDSSKTFSTKNANGKKFVFNEKQEKSELANNINHQIIHQAGNNVSNKALNSNNNLNNLNRFTKIGKENTGVTVHKTSDKVKNLFANKFA